MDWISLLALAVALAMDAFAVALAAGALLRPVTFRHCFRLGFHFGLFQGLMPVIGWLAGMGLLARVAAWDHWVAFSLLAAVGLHMIHEALTDQGAEGADRGDPTRGWTLVMLSVATSIDALAAGMSLALLDIVVWVPALVIGVVAAAFTWCGVLLGGRIGAVWGRGAGVAGGLVLLVIGLKILLTHLAGG